jgi:hypothetical protein
MVFALLAAIKAMNPVANPKWGPLQAGGLTFPLLRSGSTSVYDPTSNTMILFAGSSADDASGNPRLKLCWRRIVEWIAVLCSAQTHIRLGRRVKAQQSG